MLVEDGEGEVLVVVGLLVGREGVAVEGVPGAHLQAARPAGPAAELELLGASEAGAEAARRAEAEEDADEAAEEPAADERGPDESEFECLEALLAGADEADDQADGHREEAHVEEHVGRRALLTGRPRPMTREFIFVRAAAPVR